MNLQTGDIILSHDREGTASKFITLFTGCYWSHCAIYIGKNQVLESVHEGVQIVTLNKALHNADYVILRPIFLEEKQKKMIPLIAQEYVGYHYDYGDSFLLFKQRLGMYRRLQKNKDKIICSSLVIDIYKRIGIELCRGKVIPLPEDILKSPILNKVV